MAARPFPPPSEGSIPRSAPSSGSDRTISIEIDGPVATVLLDRPHRHNAWTGRMHQEFIAALDAIERAPAIRAVIVTGRGSAFCVGGDAQALDDHAERGGYDSGLTADAQRPGSFRSDGYDADLVWLLGYRLPVIAAVNGACAGIGLSLAALCDLRFGSAPAKITTAAPKLGLPAEYGLSWILPRIIGATRAADLLLSGRTVTVADTEPWGLWNGVYDDGPSTVAAAHAYGHLIAESCGPQAVTATKQQLYRDLRNGDVAASVSDSIARLDAAMATEEYREGIRAFLERRPPRFSDPQLDGRLQ